MNKLVFPQGTIVLLDDKPAQEVVFIVCGGRKPAANWLKMTVETVSYTHLDVYKRQLLYRL